MQSPTAAGNRPVILAKELLVVAGGGGGFAAARASSLVSARRRVRVLPMVMRGDDAVENRAHHGAAEPRSPNPQCSAAGRI